MLDVILIVGAVILGIAFFGHIDKRGLIIQFPTKADQRGIRTRLNGYIVLATIIGAIVFVQLQNKNIPGFIVIMSGATIVVITAYMKSKKR